MLSNRRIPCVNITIAQPYPSHGIPFPELTHHCDWNVMKARVRFYSSHKLRADPDEPYERKGKKKILK